MSTRSLQAIPRVQTTQVSFCLDDQQPLPTNLIFGLAGVCEALDRLTDDDDARECVGNLALAAKVLAKQLASQVT
jgi:hypothetical protein